MGSGRCRTLESAVKSTLRGLYKSQPRGTLSRDALCWHSRELHDLDGQGMSVGELVKSAAGVEEQLERRLG